MIELARRTAHIREETGKNGFACRGKHDIFPISAKARDNTQNIAVYGGNRLPYAMEATAAAV